LALHMTVGHLERAMSHRELRDWRLFEALNQPLPDRLADIHNGLLCSLMVNLVRSEDSPAVRPDDFFVIREPVSPQADDGLSEVDRQRLAWRGG
jgi:hypothetical protein